MKKKKNFIAAILCAMALSTGCSNVENTQQNDVDSSYELSFDSLSNEKNITEISIHPEFIVIGKISKKDYGFLKETDYKEINESINSNQTYSITFRNVGGGIDIDKIDLSNITFLTLDEVMNDFNYEPLMNRTYDIVDITIDEGTNIPALINFLKSIELNNGMLTINFNKNLDTIMQQDMLNCIKDIQGLNKLDISSLVIDKLDLTMLQPTELYLKLKPTDENLDFEFKINDEVKALIIAAFYEDEERSESVLENLNISTNNEYLVTILVLGNHDNNNLSIGFAEKANINVPKEGILVIMGLDLENISSEQLDVFRDFNYVYLRNLTDNLPEFNYDSRVVTFDSALEAFKSSKNKDNKRLEKHY